MIMEAQQQICIWMDEKEKESRFLKLIFPEMLQWDFQTDVYEWTSTNQTFSPDSTSSLVFDSHYCTLNVSSYSWDQQKLPRHLVRSSEKLICGCGAAELFSSTVFVPTEDESVRKLWLRHTLWKSLLRWKSALLDGNPNEGWINLVLWCWGVRGCLLTSNCKLLERATIFTSSCSRLVTLRMNRYW